MTNDKLDLQECLEHGRVAKVTVSVRPCVFARRNMLQIL